MMQPEKRSRPAGNQAAQESYGDDVNSIQPIVDDWQRLAIAVDGAFVVIVETSYGKYHRRCWLTLAPAERAALKAQNAGHNVTIALCELKPLHRVEGAAPAQPTLGRIVDAASGGAI